jgi:glycogen phosphorylase
MADSSYLGDPEVAQRLPARISGLSSLANNLWWSWHPEARRLFKVLDRSLWKRTSHNPVAMLKTIAPEHLVAAIENRIFLEKYDEIMHDFATDTAGSRTWVDAAHPEMKGRQIAYFSMEFAIHNSLPIYAGGLGVLAGDYCKEASDLGLPVVGVGFMYPQGYFDQRIDDDGWQHEAYRQMDFSDCPISPVTAEQGGLLKLKIDLDSRSVWIRVWRVHVGMVDLYLLDTTLEENPPQDRELSARLYSGDQETRLQQEILLGIGGVRVLRALGIAPTVWHANEGHAAFMALERCRELVQGGLDFSSALEEVRASTVFTTHTPVHAGNDAFPQWLIEKYFHRYWEGLNVSKGTFMSLGNGSRNGDAFSMTVLGLETADGRNGVSQLHGRVCRSMWHRLWPDTPEQSVPIGSVTNGVHLPSWIAPQMDDMYKKYLGTDWLDRHDNPGLWERTETIPDEEVWATHRWLKQKLITYVRDQARTRWRQHGCSSNHALAMGSMLDAEALTLVFSRRFTDYKRAALVLSDPDRLKRLVCDPLRPLQIIFAGKAHPNDDRGKHLIQWVCGFAKDPAYDGRIAFVEDYDMHVARYLVQGADVWLNTPCFLNEASGTSGMKAAINGVLHLSVLDGWWPEAYDGANGWAIGDGDAGRAGDSDREDANKLYHALEEQVLPLYYGRALDGVPYAWTRMMKRAISTIVPAFSARRMVKEYVERFYLPAAGIVRPPSVSVSLRD